VLRTHDLLTEGSTRPAVDVTPPPIPKSTLEARQRAREARQAQHRSTRRALRAALYVTLTLFGLVLVLGWVYTTAMRARLTAATDHIAVLESEAAGLKLELTTLRTERDALASGHLPGLVPLEYDRALPIEQQYVRNVIFTETGTAGAPQYEYRLVVANPGPGPLHPTVRLLFFDERGIQVGESRVEEDAGASAADTGSWLQPNETRSYSAVVALQHEAAPRYFLLVVQ
jgi:hypothetical protein